MSAATEVTGLRVGLYGYYGMGNLGNEGSLAAVVAHLRAAHPGVQVLCIAVEPELVQQAHGIPGIRLMSYRSTPGDHRTLSMLRKIIGRAIDVPRTVLLVGRIDVLVVPGGGALENNLSTPWGLQFWLATALTAARLRRRPSALICVGAELSTRRATRVLLRQIIRSAQYVSYRDAASREAVEALGTAGSPATVAADVAFDLPRPAGAAVRPGHVVVGVMTYRGRTEEHRNGEEIVASYVRRLSDVVAQLLDSGHTVAFVVGDVLDMALAGQLEREVRKLRPGTSRRELITSSAADLHELMLEMASAEVVIASRFHNIVAALKACSPVISLSYSRKNRDLVGRFGLSSFEQTIDSFDVGRVVQDVEVLVASRQEVSDRLGRVLSSVEAESSAHLDSVWESLLTADVIARARRRNR